MSPALPSTKRARAVTAVAACALLAACVVGPNFHAPAAPPVTRYSMAGDDANIGPTQAAVGDKVVSEWWTLFHSPALDQLVRQAIAGNPTLAQARARLEASRQAVKAEDGRLIADANAGAERERANLNAFSGGAFSTPIQGFPAFPTNPEFNLYSIGATVSYNLDLFGGLKRRTESLRASEEEKARELDAAYLTLTGQVVAQALTIADANIQIQALNDVNANDRSDLDMIRKARAAGGASAADVAQAESQLAQDRSAVPAQRQRLAAARHQMAILLGKTPAEWAPPDFDANSGSLPAVLPVAVPSELVHSRPDILEAEAKLHAATADVGVATANLYPNINLTASIEQSALTPGSLFNYASTGWNFGAGLTAPLFHSGELTAKKREAEADARAALDAYEQTVLTAFAQVADILTSLANDNQSYADQTVALDAANARVEMMRKGYAAGGVSAYQLLEAERDWRRTRLLLNQQGFGRYADAAQLLLATANVPPGVAEGAVPLAANP
ncbi:MAG TPA: efflux transporter outer membrane subunit [Caulobacteraceae bacterium]|jgi:NodT family efflux transporter outer membrane factor (OMF) lipoprotein